MIMKDIEALMEQAKNGDQSELYYLYDNRLGVFAPDFNDDDKLSDFLKECSDININLAKLSDILEHLAQKGHEWAFAYLHENGVGVFAPDFNDADKLSDFLEECVEAGLDIQEHIDPDILRDLAKGGHQWAFDYLEAEDNLYIDDFYDYLDFLIECSNNGVDIRDYDDFIYVDVAGNEDLINYLAKLGEFGYLDVDDLATYDWVEEHLEGNEEVAEIASKHLSEVFQYKEDYRWLKEQADAKIPQAQYLLGLLYLGEGNIIEKNESLGLRYLKAAEANGCTLAKEYITEMEVAQKEEYNKRKKEQERILAVKTELSNKMGKAEKGELSAQDLLALATDLAYGDVSKGIKINANKATKFYRIAAEQGSPEAQCQLGVRMIEGTGCRKNWKAGIKWLKKALKNGYEPAETYLSEYDTLFNRMLHKFIK